MPIRPPALDDRRFDDLVAELVARIPAHTPEWTNPRVGDPGRTLIDLFAWLGDALLYRANLIPERQRLAFLRLLGQPMRPAQPARGLVTVALKDGKPPAVFPFRPGASLPGPLPFEASDEFTALPVTGAAFFKRLPTADDGVADDLEQALATVHNNGAPVQLYLTAPLFAGGQPEPGGFDVFGASCDRALWVALFAPKAPDPAQQPAFNTQTVALLGATGTGSRQLLNVGLAPALPPSAAGSATNPFDIVPDLPAGRWASTSVRAQIPHLWEITVNTSGQPVTHQNPWKPEYLALDEAVDTTQGLTRSGIVRLLLPRSALLHAPANDVREDLNAGVGDRPPRLDDTGLASRLVAWLRLRPRPPQTPAPADGAFAPTSGDANGHTGSPATSGSTPPHLRLTWLGVNTVSLEQLTTRAGIVVGTSAGTADQSFPLPAGSVEPATFALSVEETSGWVPWQRVDDLAALDRDALAARDARAFELDPEAGTVRFGDGIRGRLPPAGARILAVEMRSGGGQAGNLAAGSLKTIAGTTQTGAIAGSDLVVAQPLPLTGGADAETLAEAEKRIPALFRHRDRAVTEDDYRTLAALTPGVAVGRVELLPRFKPQQRTPDVPGVVSVLVLPGVPLGPAPNPRADRPFLEAVHAWLDARRPLGTELYVIGCEYVPVAVSVAVSLEDGAATDTTLQAVKDALVRVLWPLPGGSFDGQGWKRHRAVNNRELAVEVARVSGVSEVNGLNLFRRTPAGVWNAAGDARNGREQDLAIDDWQFPELLAVVAIAGEDAPADVAANAGVNPFAAADAVAVPVVPDFCQ